MDATIVFFIAAGIVAAIIIGVVLKMRNMPQYKMSKEKDLKDGIEKWFVKIRKGFSYYYLEQTQDLPGFVNDTFAISKHQVSGHDSVALAEKIAINHRMTIVNGIEIEGE